MQIDAILGNKPLKERLRAALGQGRLPHAILLTAPDGCGRGFAARCLAADLLYPDDSAGVARLMAGESPELLVVAGEGKSGNIPVASIRAVRAQVYQTALSAAGRAVWIRDAHRMAAPAANALLKVLEEPPPGVTFLLTAGSAASLPVTIQSRCTQLSLSPVEAPLCQAVLDKTRPPEVEAAWPQKLTALYGGRIGLGLKAIADPGRLAVVEDALAAAAAVAGGDAYRLMALFARYEGKEEGARDRRAALLADLACALENAMVNQEPDSVLPSIDRAVAAGALPRVVGAAASLSQNAAPKITFTALALALTARGPAR